MAEPSENFEPCGSFDCSLPKGHNMGQADIPTNHHSEEIEHVAFNPRQLGLGGQSALERVTSDRQRDGWMLLRVVPHHPYESIAVFTRKADVSGRTKEADRG